MNIANIDFDQVLTVSALADLHMSKRPRNTVAHVGKAPAVPLTAGAVGHAENLRESAGIAGFAIGEQDQLMTIGNALGCILQQTPDERLIALTLHMRHHKLAQR